MHTPHACPRRPTSRPRSSTPLGRPWSMQLRMPRTLAALLCLALCARPAHGQNTVVLEGTVRTDAGALGGAQVTVVNSETQETARVATRPSGEFRVLGLFPGQY